MKNLVEFLNPIKEGRNEPNEALKLKDVCFSMVSVYEHNDTEGFVFKNIEEIKDLYADWRLEEELIEKIISIVNNLDVNESCCINEKINKQRGCYEIISRIK